MYLIIPEYKKDNSDWEWIMSWRWVSLEARRAVIIQLFFMKQRWYHFTTHKTGELRKRNWGTSYILTLELGGEQIGGTKKELSWIKNDKCSFQYVEFRVPVLHPVENFFLYLFSLVECGWTLWSGMGRGAGNKRLHNESKQQPKKKSN